MSCSPPLPFLTPEFECYAQRCESAELLAAYTALLQLDGAKPRAVRRFAKRFLRQLNLPELPALTAQTLQTHVRPVLEQLLEDLWHDYKTGSPPFQRRRRRRIARKQQHSTAKLGFTT